MAFLEVKDLEVYYGKARALSGISFTMEKGECAGVIGPNGAGKSTLLDSMLGLTDWRGKIIFNGVDLSQLIPSQIVGKMKVGYAPERGHLFRYMNVIENLRVGAYTMSKNREENLGTVVEMFPILGERKNQAAGTLSGGERQMLSLGRVLMLNPTLLLLDEPTLGLAPVVINEMSKVIKHLKATGHTILIAEQNARFTLAHSDRIYLLERGKFARVGTPEELKGEEYIRKTYFGV